MSATPFRRPTRLTASLLGALLAAGLLAGCGGAQKAPGGYGEGVQRDFVEGCWTTLVRDAHGDDAQAGDGSRLSADALERKFEAEAKRYQDQCSCAYGKFEDEIPFGDFKKINDDQTETPEPLEADVSKVYADCNVGEAAAG